MQIACPKLGTAGAKRELGIRHCHGEADFENTKSQRTVAAYAGSIVMSGYVKVALKVSYQGIKHGQFGALFG